MYCKLQSKQVAITHMSGLKGSMVKPCCSFSNGKDVNWDNKLQNINSFNEVLDTNQWKNLRDKTAPDNCNYCIEGEKQSNNSHSLRLFWNDIIKDNKVQLEMMHISVDSLCNMSCLSCSPVQSSSWNKKTNIKELAENGFNFKHNNELTSYVENFKRVAENTDYSKLKILKIGGGEPFYSDNVYWFIKHLESKVNLNNIDLWINTNASIIPKDNMWQLIKKFKSIHLDMSIDAVGEYHEYVRYGSKWTDVLSFIDFVKNNKEDNMFLRVHSVYSILNFNLYTNVLDFFIENDIEFTCTVLQYPKYLSVLNIPRQYRLFHLIKKYDQMEKINSSLKCDIHYENNGTLKKYLEIMEKENNNKLEDYNPELKKIIEKYNL
jgi:organic radical activating enzyme